VFGGQTTVIETWINPETRTQTITAYFAEDNITCILVSATNWSYVE